MEISKENIFKTQYSSVLEGRRKTRRTSRVINFIKQHKIISLSVIIFMTCVVLNLTLIYNFMKILGSIYT